MASSANQIPEYSLEAKRILPKFQLGKILIYVEGGDDIDFWKFILSQYCDHEELEFIPRSGRSGLEEYEKILDEGQGDFLVARDADYRHLLAGDPGSVLILHTYSHSIENVLLCRCKYQKLLKRYMRLPSINPNLANQIFSEFNLKCENLYLLDAALRILKKDTEVLNCSFDRYASVKNGTLIFDEAKIRDKVSEISEDNDLNLIIQELKGKMVEPCDGARGHFVFSFFRRRLEDEAAQGRTQVTPISRNIFFSNLLDLCPNCKGGGDCVEKINKRASAAIGVVVRTRPSRNP